MPELIYEKRGFYALFTLNRPEKLNALSKQLAADLWAAYDDFLADPKMRAGILTGAGRAFCAGADLTELAADAGAAGNRTREQGGESAYPFHSDPKPIIAAVNGLAIGAGCELAEASDIRICSTAASFGLFEVKRGLTPDYALHHLARIIPYGHAAYMVFTGDRISAEDAQRIGFVYQVVEPDRLVPRAIEIAEMIAANAPLSVQASKAVMSFWRNLMLTESGQRGRWVLSKVRESEDAKEGPRAFAEKRAPTWQGR